MIFNRSRSLPLIANVSMFGWVATATQPRGTFSWSSSTFRGCDLNYRSCFVVVLVLVLFS